jgi:hypothetical protein
MQRNSIVSAVLTGILGLGYKHVIQNYLVKRWGTMPAVEIRSADVEDWLQALSVNKVPDGLDWPTLSKMRNIMFLIYAHAQRKV